MKRILKFIWSIIFNILIIFYSLEFLTTVFLQPKTSTYVDINEQRYQKAKELGVDFDTRSVYEAFFEEKKREQTLSPKYYYAQHHLKRGAGSHEKIRNFMNEKINNNKLIPLKGPINKTMMGCTEDGKRRIIKSDKYGFKNPNFIYKKDIDVMILGDSFTEGACLGQKNDIAGYLRNKLKINTANYGIGGAGPLLSLAALSEYATYFKPTHVVYLYYEGNNMEALKEEKDTFLIKYLNDFKQDLVKKENEVLNFLDEYEKIAYEVFKEEASQAINEDHKKIEKRNLSSKKNIKEIIKDFLELQKLKTIFITKSSYGHNNSIDKKLFTKVMKKMNEITSSWGGKFIVVYLPEWNRFNQTYSFAKFMHKKKIGNIINSIDITYVDMAKEFSLKDEPMKLYNFGLFGHYTAEGYGLVAENIYKEINNK